MSRQSRGLDPVPLAHGTRSSARRGRSLPLVLGALLLVATAARADVPDNRAAAEGLFQEGRRAMSEGHYEKACRVFAESDRLDPAPGTLLNLGNCYEKMGKTATAWATFRDAEASARAAHRADYEALASRRAATLEPKLPRMTIVVAAPDPGLEVKRDGSVVGPAEWGLAVPVDPGVHTVEATAPAHKSLATRVELTAQGARARVEIPRLELEPAQVHAPVNVTSAQLSDSSGAPLPATADMGGSSRKTRRIIAGTVIGAGVVAAGFGTVVLLLGKSNYDDSLSHCRTDDKNSCDPDGVNLRDSARTDGTIATILYGAGAAAIVTGVVLWVTAPSQGERSARARIGLTPGGAVLRGVW